MVSLSVKQFTILLVTVYLFGFCSSLSCYDCATCTDKGDLKECPSILGETQYCWIGEKDGVITKGCWIFEPEKCIVGQIDVANHTIKECCEDDGCNYGDGGSIVILDTWLILVCLLMFLLFRQKE